MPKKYKLSAETIWWVVNVGYQQYTVTELCEKTGNVVSFASMWQLLKKHNVKAITVYDRAEQILLKMHQRGKLKSAQHAAVVTSINYHLVSKIIHKHKLSLTSKRAKSVIANRWKKEPYKRKYNKTSISKNAEFEAKKAQVQQLLNQTRAKW